MPEHVANTAAMRPSLEAMESRLMLAATFEWVSPVISGTQTNATIDDLAISGDGRYVAFSTWADNVVAGDTNGYADVFCYDRQTGQMQRISVGPGGVQGNRASGIGSGISMSADGRWIAYYSQATNLSVTWSKNDLGRVYLWDRLTGLNTVVLPEYQEYAGDPNAFYGEASFHPWLTPDGRYIAFVGDGFWAGHNDLFVKDLLTGALTRFMPGGNAPDGTFLHPSISDDGNWVTFASDADLNASETDGKMDVYLWNRSTGAVTLLSPRPVGAGLQSWEASISGDGRYVTFESGVKLLAADTNDDWDVYLYDRQTATLKLLSVNAAGVPGDANSTEPRISHNGQWISFTSSATNLTGSAVSARHVYLANVQTGAVELATVASPVYPNTWDNRDSALSETGKYLAFLNNGSGFNAYVRTQTFAPTLSLQTSRATMPAAGTTVRVSAVNVAPGEGTMAQVAFYRESNGQAGLQRGTGGDALIANDTDGADGWSAVYVSAGRGETFYARALDTGGNSAVVSFVLAPKDTVGNTRGTAKYVGALKSAAKVYQESIGGGDRDDYYRFTISSASARAVLQLTRLVANADLYLYDSKGRQLKASRASGTANESISMKLAKGTYYVRVRSGSSHPTNYKLSMKAS